MIRRLFQDRFGATSIEYGMIASLIAIAIVTGLTLTGSGTNSLWGRVGTAFNTHIP